jgi:hypothetical protein
LHPLDIGEGAGMELEGEDFGVEALGAITKEALLNWNVENEGEEQNKYSDCGYAGCGEESHWAW